MNEDEIIEEAVIVEPKTNKAKRKPKPKVGDDQVQIGNIILDINVTNTEFIPKEHPIIHAVEELQTISLGVKKNLPVLIIGETGTGKTSYIRHLANVTNNGFRRLNLNGSTTTDELVGHYVVDDKEKGMRWVDGVLLDSMKNGYWLLLDELNAGLPEVLFVLQSVLDDDKYLVVAEHESEIITAHPDFRVFATMNPSLEYAGTKDLNKALLSRFPLVIQTTYPEPSHEVAIIKHHVNTISDEHADLMVRVAEDIRKGSKANTISFVCSTRELISWANLLEDMDIEKSARLAILNKCELDTDRKAVEDIFKMILGKFEKKELLSLSEIEAQYKQAQEEVKKTKYLASEYQAKLGQANDEINQLKSDMVKFDELKQLVATFKNQNTEFGN